MIYTPDPLLPHSRREVFKRLRSIPDLGPDPAPLRSTWWARTLAFLDRLFWSEGL